MILIRPAISTDQFNDLYKVSRTPNFNFKFENAYLELFCVVENYNNRFVFSQISF